MSTLYRCQVFTPQDKVNKLLNIINYKKNLYGKKFLENSCGDGRVLYEVVLRYIKDGLHNQLSINQIKKGIETDIWAFEIDEIKYHECIKNLNALCEQFGIKNVKWNIFQTDYLQYSPLPKFSFIAGNPPYINFKNLPINIRNFVKENFSTCRKGKFDYCYAFIEKSISDLELNGKLAYLIPSSIFKNVFAENLRSYILPHITKIYDFKTEKVFDKALVATSILICEKGKNKKQILYRNEENKTSIKIPKTSLKRKWVFKVEESKNKTAKLKFGDLFNAQISIATLLNQAFIIKSNKNIDSNCNIEEDVIKPAKSPRNLAYNIKEQIIFPYYYKDGKLMKYKPEEFEAKYPEAVRHLKAFEDKLEKRNKDLSAEWFEYGRSQALSHLNQEKLLISTVVTDNIKVYELTKEDVPYSGIYITSKNGTPLEQAKQILNSEDFIDYVNNIGIQASGKSLRITPKDVNNFELNMEVAV